MASEAVDFLSLWMGMTALYLMYHALRTDRPGVMIWVYAFACIWALVLLQIFGK